MRITATLGALVGPPWRCGMSRVMDYWYLVAMTAVVLLVLGGALESEEGLG